LKPSPKARSGYVALTELSFGDTVALAKELKKQSPRLSLRAISAALRDKGHTAGSGHPYSASAVQSMSSDIRS